LKRFTASTNRARTWRAQLGKWRTRTQTNDSEMA
jgi:hypothetical protein